MNCRQLQKLIHAHHDGELDIAHAVQIDEHLADCPDCFGLSRNLSTLHGALQNDALRHRAPAGLRQRMRVTAAITARAEQETDPMERWGRLLWPALAAVIVIVVLAIRFEPARTVGDPMLAEITSSHIRSLMAQHLMDVASTDRHTVKPWFDGKLDFAPPVKDLADSGFPLIGGRLDYLGGRPVAALVYARDKHFINLYLWPAKNAGEIAPRAAERNGYHLVQGASQGMTFCAVSDLNAQELLDFANRWNQP